VKPSISIALVVPQAWQLKLDGRLIRGLGDKLEFALTGRVRILKEGRKRDKNEIDLP
jgi:hypothetical protein